MASLCLWSIGRGSQILCFEYSRVIILWVIYDRSLKPFYMRLNSDGDTVAAFDLLVPRVGELVIQISCSCYSSCCCCCCPYCCCCVSSSLLLRWCHCSGCHSANGLCDWLALTQADTVAGFQHSNCRTLSAEVTWFHRLTSLPDVTGYFVQLSHVCRCACWTASDSCFVALLLVLSTE